MSDTIAIEITAEPAVSVYVKLDEENRITAVNSSVFLTDTEGWTKIDEGYGDRYIHAQNYYFDDPYINDEGQYCYHYKDGRVKQITDAA